MSVAGNLAGSGELDGLRSRTVNDGERSGTRTRGGGGEDDAEAASGIGGERGRTGVGGNGEISGDGFA